MPNELAPIQQNDLSPIIKLVTDSVASPQSKRVYKGQLQKFIGWFMGTGQPLSKAAVNAYISHRLESNDSVSSINQGLTAIKKLAREAADNGLLPLEIALAIGRIENVKQDGARIGNWLSKAEAKKLINAPDKVREQTEKPNELKLKRDKAILAMLIGTGLRRFEIAGLTWEHIQQRDGRWAIVDLIGKRNRIRSIGIPAWCMVELNKWKDASEQDSGNIFLSIHKGGYIDGSDMTPQAIYNIVDEYSTFAGLNVAAHDLRRTAASLALNGGASIRQIQQMLGHSSIVTTERYLEKMTSLTDTANDYIKIEL